MTFVLPDRRPAFDWPVYVSRPDPISPGKHLQASFVARFDPLTPEEEEAQQAKALGILDALPAETQAGAEDRGEGNGGEGDGGEGAADPIGLAKSELRRFRDTRTRQEEEAKALLRRIWIGWGTDLVDQDNAPIPYSDAVREQLLGFPEVRRAVLAAYTAAMNPEAKTGARRGN